MKDEVAFYTEDQNTRHLCYQMLMGDATDNVPGIQEVPESYKKVYGIRSRKVGKKTAEQLLKGLSAEESLLFVGKAYAEANHDRDYLKQQLNLLWMARERDGFGEIPCILGEASEHYRKMLEGYEVALPSLVSLSTVGANLWSEQIMAEYKAALSRNKLLLKSVEDYLAKAKS
jgi:5'-3' exonuclease